MRAYAFTGTYICKNGIKSVCHNSSAVIFIKNTYTQSHVNAKYYIPVNQSKQIPTRVPIKVII